MSRNYKFHNPDGTYFVSFAVIDWMDVFTRPQYKNKFLETLEYSQQNKGLEVFAWCIMTNHVHLVFRTTGSNKPEQVLGDIKRFTSRSIIAAIKSNPQESRKEWLIAKFKEAGRKTSNTTSHQFWRHDNKPIELWSNKVLHQKISYVHNNPVAEGLVHKPEDYLYSSARDYAGEKGYLNDVILVR
ncbi:MAG: transposase [Salibacteraceae bacterium]